MSEFWIFKPLAEQVSHDHLPLSMVNIGVSWKVASVAADSNCMLVGMMVLETFHLWPLIQPTLHVSSETSNVISASICLDRLARLLYMNTGTNVGEVTTTAEGGYRGGWCVELLSLVYV